MVAPCVLLFGQSIRTRLDLLSPDPAAVVSEQQAKQKRQHDQHSGSPELHIGQSVMVHDFLQNTKWVEGTVLQRLGPVTYLIQLPRGVQWKRHIDHIRARSAPTSMPAEEGGESHESFDHFGTVTQETPTSTDGANAVEEATHDTVDIPHLPVSSRTPVPTTNHTPPVSSSRYPSRVHTAPDHYKP